MSGMYFVKHAAVIIWSPHKGGGYIVKQLFKIILSPLSQSSKEHDTLEHRDIRFIEMQYDLSCSEL